MAAIWAVLGQRISGDRTRDPWFACPNADHCTTASPCQMNEKTENFKKMRIIRYMIWNKEVKRYIKKGKQKPTGKVMNI